MPVRLIVYVDGQALEADSVRVHVEGLPEIVADGDTVNSPVLEYILSAEGIQRELYDEGQLCGVSTETHKQIAKVLYMYY